MATCPRCMGPLEEGHICKPLWPRRLMRRAFATLLGAGLGAGVQLLASQPAVPVLGLVFGGLFSFIAYEVARTE